MKLFNCICLLSCANYFIVDSYLKKHFNPHSISKNDNSEIKVPKKLTTNKIKEKYYNKISIDDFDTKLYSFDQTNWKDNQIIITFYPSIKVENDFVMTFQYSLNGSENYYFQKQFESLDEVPITIDFEYLKKHDYILNFKYTLYIPVTWPDGSTTLVGEKEHEKNTTINLAQNFSDENLNLYASSSIIDTIRFVEFEERYCDTDKIFYHFGAQLQINFNYDPEESKFLIKNNDLELFFITETKGFMFNDLYFDTTSYPNFGFDHIDTQLKYSDHDSFYLVFNQNNFFDDILQKIIFVSGSIPLGLYLPFWDNSSPLTKENHFSFSFRINNWFNRKIVLNLYPFLPNQDNYNIFNFFNFSANYQTK